MRVLVLAPDPATWRSVEELLTGGEIRSAGDQAAGLELLRNGSWDLVLLDEAFSGAGLELLPRIVQSSRPGLPVVLLSSSPSMDTTLEAIRRGAADVLTPPLSGATLREILAASSPQVPARPVQAEPREEEMVGGSPGMLAVYKSLARAANSDATVLLLGESGTGKEMLARTLHARSPRARGPFVAINCAAIPENLLESELFGHEKGAFTGAIGRRIGRFERANGGTLFLDEVGDMSLALQAKILRALNEREVERVGGNESVPFDVRIVAATNQNLATAVTEGRFREDLYYRLAVVTLHLPPLRDRGGDLDQLVEHFAALYARRHGRAVRAVAERTFDALRELSWPGNVRQLRNAIERAVVMCDGPVLLPEHLPPETRAGEAQPATAQTEREPPLVTIAEMEQRLILRAIAATGGNHTRAAEVLGIHRNTLRRKIADYGIDMS